MGTQRSKKIIQIIGTRPQLIKVIPDLGSIINTGQHMDREMNEAIIEERGLDILCNIGATELGDMITKLTKILEKTRPDIVVVYGDTRSTLAGAVVASGLGIPLAHIEAGLRCYDMHRPEERIRRMVDQISDYLFCPTERACMNLEDEGVAGKIRFVGDVLYDEFLKSREHAGYTFVTIHRAEHTDIRKELKDIVDSLKGKVIWPMHPRTSKMLAEFNIKLPKNIEVIKPLSHKDTLNHIKRAELVITDSGGVSREAFWAGTPVKIIGESEWDLHPFGDGRAAEKIKEILNARE